MYLNVIFLDIQSDKQENGGKIVDLLSIQGNLCVIMCAVRNLF